MSACSRWIVLGGRGKVGSLATAGFRRALPQLSLCVQARQDAPHVDWVADPDICTEADFVHGMAEQGAGAVLVLWGVTSADGPLPLSANTDLACRALVAAAAAGVPHVLVASTAAVYGLPETSGPLDESAPLMPRNAYGSAKVEMEQALRDIWDALPAPKPRLTLLRLANVVGADMLAQSVLASRNRKKPVLLDRFSDGRGPRRSYLSPVTLARACAALDAAGPPEDLQPEALNLADGARAVDMADILSALSEQTRPVMWRWQPAPKGALAELSLSSAALERRCPDLSAAFRRSSHALVSDWLVTAGDRV